MRLEAIQYSSYRLGCTLNLGIRGRSESTRALLQGARRGWEKVLRGVTGTQDRWQHHKGSCKASVIQRATEATAAQSKATTLDAMMVAEMATYKRGKTWEGASVPIGARVRGLTGFC